MWNNANKQGVGTSESLESRVWFTLGSGVLNEVYYPTVDKANVRTLELMVTDGRSWAELESLDTEPRIEVPDARALVFRQVNTSRAGRYRISKTYTTDPERDVLLIHVRFEPLQPGPMRLYVLYNPHLNNSGLHDTGYTRGSALLAADGPVASALIASLPFTRTSSGYLGTNDGWSDLKKNFRLTQTYARAVSGNVVQTGELPEAASKQAFTLALGFGPEGMLALRAAEESLRKGFDAAVRQYTQGWHDYLATLKPLQEEQFRDQYYMAAMLIKAHEDKTWRGAGVASLTKPWGNEVDASEPTVGGYHLVWSRDLYHVGTAFYAMGDKESADRALNYLFSVQQREDGSFPQNSWLDGRPYWPSLQLDQVAYPIIMAYQFGRTDGQTWVRHVKPAAEFLLERGPRTPQERWEEEGGYSPSTIAAEIAGLVCAAEIARRNRDQDAARRYLAVADEWEAQLESWVVTRNGPLSQEPYIIRISQRGQPNAGDAIELKNGAGTWDEREIVDAGFLELVRFGIRPADDPLILHSLEVVDRHIHVSTPNGPGWYRYTHDGYGEKADGRGWDGVGTGRLWTLLTGERGNWALAGGRDARPYLETMLRMANPGRMLAEQVWDREQSPRPHLRFGEGTGSATPLAWSNAQFIRLAIGIQEGRVPEMPDVVVRHFQQRRNEAAPQAASEAMAIPAP